MRFLTEVVCQQQSSDAAAKCLIGLGEIATIIMVLMVFLTLATLLLLVPLRIARVPYYQRHQ